MAKVLVLKHVASEGPGLLKDGFEKAGAEVLEVNLYEGESIPEAGEYQVVVSMGGPMNVYEDHRYPFLKEEAEFLKRRIDEGEPVLGICLGAQMIARACGAKVRKAEVEEIGWFPVHITSAGRADELFWDFPSQLQVFQWHGDTFEVPPQGTLLFKAPLCPNQAFRIRNAYALQFHIEVTEELLSTWFRKDPKLKGILSEYARRSEGLKKLVFSVCERLMKVKGFDEARD